MSVGYMNRCPEAEAVTILREKFIYEPGTGALTWREGRHAGQAVKTMIRGYLVARVMDTGLKAHRIAWTHYYGRRPGPILDHINRNRVDNRILNLREVTQSQNRRNSSLPVTNTSGFRGVCWCKTRERWLAHLNHKDFKTASLGRFKTKEAAARAYDAAAVQHYGEFAVTNVSLGLLPELETFALSEPLPFDLPWGVR